MTLSNFQKWDNFIWCKPVRQKDFWGLQND